MRPQTCIVGESVVCSKCCVVRKTTRLLPSFVNRQSAPLAVADAAVWIGGGAASRLPDGGRGPRRPLRRHRPPPLLLRQRPRARARHDLQCLQQQQAELEAEASATEAFVILGGRECLQKER